MRVKCPHCGASVDLRSDADLERIKCSSCEASFSIPLDETLDQTPATARRSVSLAASDRIGHFDLIRRLGIGAIGEVWQAFDTKLTRIVVLKLYSGGRTDQVPVETFEREATMLAQS